MSPKQTAKKKPSKKIKVSSDSFLNNKYVLAGILTLTFFLFLNTITKNFFTLDDPAYVADNPYIKSLSPAAIKDIFSSFHNANYHPFTTLLYAIEYRLFGLNAQPYHFINLLIHLLNIVLVYLLIQKISGRKEVAAIAALFFAIHPMHVESVAWISELKDVLYSFFYLAGLCTYLKYLQANTGKNRWYIYTLLLFLFSLFSKSAAVTFPVMLLLIDFYYNRGWKRNVLIEKIPFLILSLAFGVITILSQKSAGAINADLMPYYSLGQRFFVVCYTVSYYIIKLFLPFNLAVLHYAPRELPYYFYLSPLFLLLLVFLVYKAKKIRHQLIFGLGFYLVGVSLTSQVIPVGYAVVSERYSYISYIGLFFIAGYLYVGIREKMFSFSAKWKPYINYLLVGFTLFFVVITFQRNTVWKDSVSLFTDVTKKYPQASHAHFTLGKNLMDTRDVNAALASLNKAIELDPRMSDAYFIRGNLYYGQGNYQAALSDYRKAVEINPKYAEALYNLGVCYNTLGNFTEGMNALTSAINIRPNEYMYQSRATAFFNLNRYQDAINDYTKALAINPQLGETLFNRGVSYYRIQEQAKACDDWRKSVGLGYTKANEMLGAFCR
ncbi:MAG TPA: tetratricopeptide repeat protein [Chitinophagaceae bacterium]|nr:tetratricopeptide repeat protein [Chitinophagaceae bacterium]